MKKILSAFVTAILLVVTGTSLYFYYHPNLANSKADQFLIILNKAAVPIVSTSSTPSIDRPPVRVPILVYHSVRPYHVGESKATKIYDVEPKNFALQLKYLREHDYTTIGFDDLANYFNGTKLPAKPVIINFDDGLDNQYINAFPLLKKEKMTATFFIYSNAIGRKKFLTWKQVQELSDAGMTIGGHSKSHPYLWKITDQLQLKKEITDNKKIIESHIGKTINTFAYPFGLYKPITIAEVKAAGYTTARTGYERATHTKQDLYTLHSIQVSSNMKMFVGVLENLK